MARTLKPSGLQKKRNRSNQSYSRRESKFEPARTILIVCEGSKTEPAYFNKLKEVLRLSSVEPRPIQVDVEGEACQSAPLAVVQFAITLTSARVKEISRGATNKSKFDEVWCVVDTETDPQNNSLLSAIGLAKERGFNLVISNPAFEFWYLLHYEYTTRIFHNADDLVSYLSKYIPGYEKNWVPESDFFTLLEVAITHAEKVSEYHLSVSESDFSNPSTNVYGLAQTLLEISKQSERRRSTH